MTNNPQTLLASLAQVPSTCQPSHMACTHLSQGNGSAAIASGESSGGGVSNGQAAIGEGLGGGVGDRGTAWTGKGG